MNYIRAGGITTLLLTLLAAAVMTGFGAWYSSLTSGEVVERLVMWFGLTFLPVAPLCLVVLPLIHLILGFGSRPAGRTFALLGGICGAIIAGYALFRFRAALFPQSGIALLAIPAMVIGATLLGIFGGFLFERLARHRKPEAVIIEPPSQPSKAPYSDEGPAGTAAGDGTADRTDKP